MFEVILQDDKGTKHKFHAKNGSCRIGSGRNNDIVMKSRHVAKSHAVIELDKSGCHIEDQGSMSGTWVNRDRIVSMVQLIRWMKLLLGNSSCGFTIKMNRLKLRG